MNSVRFLYFVRHKEKLLSVYVFFTLNSSGAARALADRLLSHLGETTLFPLLCGNKDTPKIWCIV